MKSSFLVQNQHHPRVANDTIYSRPCRSFLYRAQLVVVLDVHGQRSLCRCMSTSTYKIIMVSVESIHLKSPASQTEAKLLVNLREIHVLQRIFRAPPSLGKARYSNWVAANNKRARKITTGKGLFYGFHPWDDITIFWYSSDDQAASRASHVVS